MNVDNIYIKTNPDWEHDRKSKYGYVNGDNTNLVNRLSDSTEEHSELSKFSDILLFKKTADYKLHNEPDKILSLIAPHKDRIEEVEKRYSTKLPLLRELNEHLLKSSLTDE